jgi:hypothetical protein
MPLSDGISTADSIINTVIVLPVDGISLSESITSQNVFAPLSDTISLTDDPDISLWFSLSESISIDDDVFSIYYKPTLGTVMAGDFSDSLADTIDEDVTLRQVVNTQDSSGNTTLVTETDIAITGKFTDITFSDFEQLGIGENAFGYIKGYFKPSYTVSGTDYSVAVGDEIVRNSIVYRVVTILGTFELADTEIFVKTLLRRE